MQKSCWTYGWKGEKGDSHESTEGGNELSHPSFRSDVPVPNSTERNLSRINQEKTDLSQLVNINSKTGEKWQHHFTRTYGRYAIRHE